MRLFNHIKDPNDVNVLLLFNACAQLATPEALSVVNAISSSIPKSLFSNPRLNNSLLDAFIKCGDLVRAEKLFNTIDRSAISYGNLMSGYNRFNRSAKTIELFYQMERELVVPDSCYFPSSNQCFVPTAKQPYRSKYHRSNSQIHSGTARYSECIDRHVGKCTSVPYVPSTVLRSPNRAEVVT